LTLSRDAVLEIFARHEAAQEAETPDMIYANLLATVHRRLAKEWQATTSEDDNQRFGASVPQCSIISPGSAMARTISSTPCRAFSTTTHRPRSLVWSPAGSIAAMTAPAGARRCRRPPGARYDFRFISMAEMVSAHKRELRDPTT
jgi:hypothetical protein